MKISRYTTVVILSVAFLTLVLFVVNLFVGSVEIPFGDTLRGLMRGDLN